MEQGSHMEAIAIMMITVLFLLGCIFIFVLRANRLDKKWKHQTDIYRFHLSTTRGAEMDQRNSPSFVQDHENTYFQMKLKSAKPCFRKPKI